ncbi:unnamed protein product [Vitrella brassicaformis CCMP3155]|uniref:CBS domain-containing protein n=1 Tax=Vitrella brassicaformis (strain CCMP3155) TaxID=1169540 RepID=A0A0G4EE00_VITBC|nr:unnamed protein product [Vitrella brassicaformis CCMP3155]|eukprot:CEL93578.1 unnamed protein product [Vitrella brassicaformis CCMP3155]
MLLRRSFKSLWSLVRRGRRVGHLSPLAQLIEADEPSTLIPLPSAPAAANSTAALLVNRDSGVYLSPVNGHVEGYVPFGGVVEAAGRYQVVPRVKGQTQWALTLPLHITDRHNQTALTTIEDCLNIVRSISVADLQMPPSGDGAEEAPASLSDLLADSIYVTQEGELRGYVTMGDLLMASPHTPLKTVLKPTEVVRISENLEEASKRLRQRFVTMAPLVDEKGQLVGILSPNDLLNEMEAELTEDLLRFEGIFPSETMEKVGDSYFATPVIEHIKSRAGWVVSLLFLQSLSSIVLTKFQGVIERNLVIALFLTMLTGTAGNAGNQSSATVIRGLATGEITHANAWKVVLRELRIASVMAVLLAGAAFMRVALTPGSTVASAVVVGLAMGATCLVAIILGTLSPIILEWIGLDPCNCASPALATATDVAGVLILCTIASVLLGGGEAAG